MERERRVRRIFGVVGAEPERVEQYLSACEQRGLDPLFTMVAWAVEWAETENPAPDTAAPLAPFANTRLPQAVRQDDALARLRILADYFQRLDHFEADWLQVCREAYQQTEPEAVA
jgi:hypothetical protein